MICGKAIIQRSKKEHQGPAYDLRCKFAITARLTKPAVSDGTCAKTVAPIRSLSYVSSTLRAISSRLEPVTILAIAFVIDALICFFLFTGSMVCIGVSLHLRNSPLGCFWG